MVKPDGKKRISKIDTYLNVAETFAYRSTCLKRRYGAVIVKDDTVISTGYNGSPRGFENCCDVGECERIRQNMHQGEDTECARLFTQSRMHFLIAQESLQWVQIFILQA